MNAPSICSLFSGIGGIDLAFINAGCKIVYANEMDKDACATYRHNFPEANLVMTDIKSVDENTLPDFRILVAGFPCQAFSVCGYQKGFKDERGNLFFEICRILEAKQPEAVFLENVANLVKHDKGKTFEVICDSLKSLGYAVTYAVMDACEYGVPQHRTRTYIVAFRDPMLAETFVFPDKKELNLSVFDVIDRNESIDKSFYLDPEGQQFKRMNREIDDERQVYRFSDYGVQKGKDGISFTLKANMGTWYNREPIIRDAFGIRKLTPKECLMLQGFPESFSFPDIPVKSAYKQAGNTVCVPVVEQIAKRIVEALPSEESVPKAKEDTPGVTIIGTVRNKQQITACLKYKFYHFPVSLFGDKLPEAEYVALYIPRRLSGRESGIAYVGRVTSRCIVKRSEITEIPKKSDRPYCKLTVREWKEYKGNYKPTLSGAVTVTAKNLIEAE